MSEPCEQCHWYYNESESLRERIKVLAVVMDKAEAYAGLYGPKVGIHADALRAAIEAARSGEP